MSTEEYPPPVEEKAPILRQKEQRNLGIGLLVIVLLFATILLHRHFQDDRPKAEVGSLITAADPVPVDDHRTVLVPGVSIDVGVTADLDDVPGDLAARKDQAPDGASFIGVRVTGKRTTPTELPVFSNGSTPSDLGVHLTLVAGGHDYPLGAGDSSEDSDPPVAGYLPVTGSPSSVSVKATWGGRSQTVDLRSGKRDAGDFALLYQHHQTATSSCGTGTLPAGWSPATSAPCRFHTERYPYVLGHGWAAKGKSWLVVSMSVQTPTALTRTVDGARVEFYLYGPGDDKATIRVDGTRAVDTKSLFDSDSKYSVLALLAVPASGSSTSTVSASAQGYFDARVAPAGAEYAHYVRTSWSASVRG